LDGLEALQPRYSTSIPSILSVFAYAEATGFADVFVSSDINVEIKIRNKFGIN
jgi:hypothetical protein